MDVEQQNFKRTFDNKLKFHVFFAEKRGSPHRRRKKVMAKKVFQTIKALTFSMVTTVKDKLTHFTLPIYGKIQKDKS